MLGRTTTKNQPLSARPMNPVKRPTIASHGSWRAFESRCPPDFFG